LRFVDLHLAVVDDTAIEHDLIAGTDLQHIAYDELFGRHVARCALAHDCRVGPREQRDPIEGAFGADFLYRHSHVGRITPSETSASPARPTKINATASVRMTMLMNVKMFSRTICA
jgi:hypothetical protein